MKNLLSMFLIRGNKQSNNQTIKQSLTKIFLLAIVLLTTNSFLNAQIKVDANGKIGLHSSTTSASADVLILGSARIQNAYGGTVFFGSDYSYPQIWPGTATSGQVGTSAYPFSDVYAYSIRGYNLYTQYSTLHASDKRFKENIRGIEKSLDKILQMTGKKYDYIADKFDTIGTEKEKQKKATLKKDKLGFIAQEMKEILPEAVVYEEDEDRYYIDYNAVIPVLVEAIKELNTKIDVLESNATKEKSATIGNTDPASLNQNIPNPFTANTSIEMYIPSTVSRAALYIYNMQGEQIKQITVNERGKTSITIEGHTLKAGMYLYTLIADGKEVDTKRMILTK
jgi:hypothetical protein